MINEPQTEKKMKETGRRPEKQKTEVRNGAEKGSLTIELSLLIPMIMGMFVFIIFSGFIMHDRFMVDKACLSAALRGSSEQDDDEALRKAGEAINEVLPLKMTAIWDYDTKIDIGEDMVRVSFEGNTTSGSGIFGSITGLGNKSYSFECSGYRLNEARYIRDNKPVRAE